MFTLSKILVPTDFGPPSEAAIEYALGLASTVGASVTVFHAYEIPVIGVPDGTFVATPEMVNRIQAAAERALESSVQACRGRAGEALHARPPRIRASPPRQRDREGRAHFGPAGPGRALRPHTLGP